LLQQPSRFDEQHRVPSDLAALIVKKLVIATVVIVVVIGASRASAQPSEPDVAWLEANAKLAAQEGRCESAAHYVARIVEVDPSYSVGGDEALARCLAPAKPTTTPEPQPRLEAKPAPTPKSVTVEHRYGGVIVGVDLASAALVLVGGVGILTYPFGAPAVHAVAGNGSAAAKSFGLRLIPYGVAVGTVYTLCFHEECSGDTGALGAILLGLIVGGVSAVIVSAYDASVLAVRVENKPATTGATIVPTITVKDDAATLGVIGRW
jgi:hypothetical protein